MARGGVYKTDVLKARDSVLAEGLNPSIDAVRAALGNTGSRTTIHRYMKEIEAEEKGRQGSKVAVSDALQDLVGRLAERLHAEADEIVATMKSRSDEALASRDTKIADQQRENAELRGQVERLEANLAAERSAHQLTASELNDARATARQLEERIAGLNIRIVDHEAHAASLETKHQQAREALEHYRNSVKEQRDQENQRHQHEVQGLQLELRRQGDAVTAKNQELVTLNRDNARLSEQLGQRDQDLQRERELVRRHSRELEELRPIVDEHRKLKDVWAAEVNRSQSLDDELTKTSSELAREVVRRSDAEAAQLRAETRLQTLESVLATMSPKASPDEATAPKDPPSQAAGTKR